MAWLSDWQKRIKITIDNSNIDSDLTHFPHLVKLGTSVGQSNEDVSAVFDEVGDNWQRIAVTDSSGDTQLYVEKEYWNSTAEEASLWISDSTWTINSSSTTDIYLYFDNSKSANTSYVAEAGNRTEVWQSGTYARYGLAEDPTGTIIDSTSNNRDGTSEGSMTSGDEISAKVGEAQDFDGSDDDVNLGDVSVPNAETIIIVFSSEDQSEVQRLFGDEPSGGAEGQSAFIHNSGANNDIYFGAAFGGNWNNHDTGVSIADSNYHHVAIFYDGSDVEVWKDGSKDFTTSQTGNLPDPANDFKIGFSTGQDSGQHFDGPYDEFAWYSTGMSDAFIKTHYHSSFDNLNTFGSVEQSSTLATGSLVASTTSSLSGLPTTSTTASATLVQVTASSLFAKLAGVTGTGSVVPVSSDSITGSGLVTVIGSGNVVTTATSSFAGEVAVGLTADGSLVVIDSSSINGTVGTGIRLVDYSGKNASLATIIENKERNDITMLNDGIRLATIVN